MVSTRSLVQNVIAVLVLSYIGKSIYLFLASLGVGVHFNNVRPGKCRIVPGISCGSEKISVTVGGLAFITSGYREITRCNREYLKGRLYTFDFNQPSKNVTQLEIRGENFNVDSFIPHGMDIYERPGENIIDVYIINHADEVESVEVFVYDRKNPSEITHKMTITDSKFECLNDIAVVDPDHFYITNLGKYCSGMSMTLEALFLPSLRTGSVVYFNHGHTTFVARGAHTNGLSLSKNKRHVLVVNGGTKDVHVYAINPSDGHLDYVRNVVVGHGSDNIILDKHTGDFYVAYFKNVGPLLVAENRSEYCGSSGGKLSVGSEAMDDVDLTEVLHDDGKEFVCGASSIVHYQGQYLVGTVFDKLGYCVKE